MEKNLDRVHIFNFNGNYKPRFKCPPEKDGYYMTIRCGLGGIYTNLDEWKNGHWQVGILDDSRVIAYSREQIPEEEVNEWINNKLSKYKNVQSSGTNQI